MEVEEEVEEGAEDADVDVADEEIAIPVTRSDGSRDH